MKRQGPSPDEPPTVDTEAIARLAGEAVVEHIVDRTSSGMDVHDEAFVGYSTQYAEDKARLGRTKDGVGTAPDLTMTGGLLNSVQVLEVNATAFGHTAVVGVGTGTSKQMRPPPKRKKKRRVKRLDEFDEVDGRWRLRKTKTTGARGGSHNVVAEAHNTGAGHAPQREFFGVSPSGQPVIDRQVMDGLPPLKGR